jgi:uncharacterized protein (TIGR00251 family)
MSDWSDYFDEDRGGVVLRVHVQPRAARPGAVGRHGDALKLRVASPPVDDRANREVESLIAALVGVPVAAVTVVGGSRSRAKRVRLEGVDGVALVRALRTVAPEGAAGAPGA